MMIWALSFEEWIFVLISWVLPKNHVIKRMFVNQFYLRNSLNLKDVLFAMVAIRIALFPIAAYNL